jgi:hypothetical protein
MKQGVHHAEIKAAIPGGIRQQIIELAGAGKTPVEHSREFGPTVQTILNRNVSMNMGTASTV